MDNQFTFLKRRQEFEADYFNKQEHLDVLKSISVVDVSTTDLCNRTCVFCPHHDPRVFPNRNLRMTTEGATTISKKLQYIDYNGTIAISGFGENLLNPDIVNIVRVFKQFNPGAFLECNTNGDPLTKKLATSLIEAGLDCLNVNMYDGEEQVAKFNDMLDNIPENKRKYRIHWGTEDHGIIFNNRSGVIKWLGKKEVNKGVCFYPFYKLFIDWNGDVLFCANDWGREKVVGNLMQQSIYEVWMSKEMRKVRETLAEDGRTFSPCSKCSVEGTLIGKQSFDLLMSK